VIAEKKKRYSVCMSEKTHERLTKFVKKNKRQERSLSDFLTRAGLAEIDRRKVRKGVDKL
jgi:hypothetical protein